MLGKRQPRYAYNLNPSLAEQFAILAAPRVSITANSKFATEPYRLGRDALFNEVAKAIGGNAMGVRGNKMTDEEHLNAR